MFLTLHLCAFLLTSSACVSTLSFLSSLLDCQHSADLVSFPFIFIHRQALPDAHDTKRTDCYRRPSAGFPRLARRRSSVDHRCSVSTEAHFFLLSSSLSTRTLGFRSLSAARGHVIECVCAESGCELTDEVKEELRVGENGMWRVTEDLYEEHGIQQIIDCAEEGDVISLDASLTIRPPSRIEARRNVTILGGRRLDGGLLTKRTIFNCPPGEGLFLLKCVSTVVLLVNAVCTAEAASRWSTLSSRTATWLRGTESWPSSKWTPASNHPLRDGKCVFPTCCSKTTRISADLSVWLCAIRPVAARSNCATSPSRQRVLQSIGVGEREYVGQRFGCRQ